MSARVTTDSLRADTHYVDVPKVDRAEVDSEGRLHLYQGWGGTELAIFRAVQWDYVVITPERGRDGRFVRRT